MVLAAWCLALVALVALVAACSDAGAGSRTGVSPGGQPVKLDQVRGEATVEVDVFSGRPTPTFRLSAAEVSTLATKLSALAPAPAGAIANPLGYRGFVVELVTASGPMTVRVQNGTVEVADVAAATTSRLQDSDRGVERWLFDLSHDRLPAEVTAIVADQLG